MKDQFDLDDLFESDMPQPPTGRTPHVPSQPVVTTWTTGTPAEVKIVSTSVPSNTEVLTNRRDSRVKGCLGVVAGMLFSLVVGVAIGWLIFRGGSDQVIDPDVDPVDGAYVAMFYNDTDLGKYTESQREFLNSVNTANYLEERKVNWKKIDTDPMDISRLEKPFQVMSEKHRSKEPWIVIASGKKFASEPIESNDQAMKLLQKWIK